MPMVRAVAITASWMFIAGCSIDQGALVPPDATRLDASGADADTSTPPPDSGVRDTGTPRDTSVPMDVGAPDTDVPADTSVPRDTTPPSTCGDRMIEGGETCDDGNTTGGDGCSGSCATESTADACPGRGIVLRHGVQRYLGTNVGASSTESCRTGFPGFSETGFGPDIVYAIAPQYSGMLSIRVDAPGFDVVLQTKSACPGFTDHFCEDSEGTGGSESLTGWVTNGVRYMVVVSGYQASDQGSFEITFTGS